MSAGEQRSRTGADGQTVLTGLPDEPVGVWVQPPRSMRRRLWFESLREVPTTIDEVGVVLKTVRFITGIVLDPEGEPIPRALVLVGLPGSELMPGPAAADESGHFRIPAPGWEKVDLTVDGIVFTDPRRMTFEKERRPVFGRVEGVPAPSSGVTIRTEKAAWDRSVTVLVLGPDGTPAEGLQVRLRTPWEWWWETTDANGRATFTGLRDDEYTVGVWPLPEENGDPALPCPERVRVRPAGQTVTVTIREGTFLTGTVRGPDGEPVAGATVTARRHDGDPTGTVSTGPDGRFRVPAVPGEPHDLTVDREAPWPPLHGKREGVVPGTGVEITIRR